MHNSDNETHLGNQISKDGKHSSTIAKRGVRGYDNISGILFIYDSERRVQVGLELRQSWFKNSMLPNAEAWHNLLNKDLNTLNK